MKQFVFDLPVFPIFSGQCFIAAWLIVIVMGFYIGSMDDSLLLITLNIPFSSSQDNKFEFGLSDE